MDVFLLIVKIVCLILCAVLLFICYRTRTFAKKILKKNDDEITDALMLKIKAIALVISMALFVIAILFIG